MTAVGSLWKKVGSADPWLVAAAGLAAWLRLGRLSDFDNAYYTAVVASLLQSPHNFLYGSFDPAGLVMVDKPPLAFWVQAIFPSLFGVSRWAVNLPQAIAGVLSVLLVYWTLRQAFGRVAAVAAALTLVALPASIVIDSRNEPDGLLSFVLLLAALCMIKAVRSGRAFWLMCFAVLIGLAFNIKMLVAFVPLPAFFLYFLLASRLPLRRRAISLASAVVLLAVVSLSWVSLVALTPADSRPYVGSTRDNSIWTLTFKYNGLDRFTSFIGPRPAQLPPTPSAPIAPPGGQAPGAPGYPPQPGASQASPASPGPGDRGILGLLVYPLAAQLGWLLPAGLLAMAAVLMALVSERVAQRPWSFVSEARESREVSESVLWAGWLATGIVVFGLANATTTHPYYLVGIAVSLAAVMGIGCSRLWEAFRRGGLAAWLLPAALAGVVAYQIATSRGMVGDWIVAVVLAAAFLSLVLVVGALARSLSNTALTRACLVVGGLSLLAIPMTFGAGFGGQIATGPGVQRPSSRAGTAGVGPDQRLVEPLAFFLRQQGEQGRACAVGVVSAREAAPFIVAGLPAVAIGGFSGNDPVFTVDSLKTVAEERGVRCFLMPRTGGGPAIGPAGSPQQPILNYVRSAWTDQSGALGLPRGAFYTQP